MKNRYIVFSIGLNEFLKSEGFNPIIDEESEKYIKYSDNGKNDGTCLKSDGKAYWRYEMNDRLGKQVQLAINNEHTKQEIKEILDKYLESKSNYKGMNI